LVAVHMDLLHPAEAAAVQAAALVLVVAEVFLQA
jgi:hypothetical protein